MILYQWRGPAPNFGDELNGLLWPRLLPGFFDGDPSARFLGIGSVLDSRHGRDGVKLVAGAGYGGYEPPVALDQHWIVHWVRGPRTARLLGLDAELGLGDPASLLPAVGFRAQDDRAAIGFMPHFESLERGHWAEASHRAGLSLIDPRGDPAAVIAAIGRCRVLVSEALHGVIAADALRVPWIAARPLVAVHRPKWLDWADSLGLRIRFRALAPSSLLEQLTCLPLAERRTNRTMLARHGARLRATGSERLIERAATALRRVALEPPQLSDALALDRAQARMWQRITRIQSHPFRAMSRLRRSDPGPSLLRVEEEFAYHPLSTG